MRINQRSFVQIIGRVEADPDYLPRSGDFGLNQAAFREKFCHQCPEPFYRIAFLCCELNPDKRYVFEQLCFCSKDLEIDTCHRPPFEVMEVWLESLGMHLAVGASVPQDLIVDIYTYTGIRLLCYFLFCRQ